MMDWLNGIPIIGKLFEQVGEAVDRNITTDAERLKLKAELTQLYIPVLTTVLEAQKSTNELQVKLAEVESKSEHWLVWSRRPIIAFMSIGNLIMAGIAGYMDVKDAMYLALVINGLDTGTRGLEKVVGKLKEKEII